MYRYFSSPQYNFTRTVSVLHVAQLELDIHTAPWLMTNFYAMILGTKYSFTLNIEGLTLGSPGT